MYKWNPPTYTKEELERAKAFRAKMIRKEAAGWDVSGDWQRAMGVIPESDEIAFGIYRGCQQQEGKYDGSLCARR